MKIVLATPLYPPDIAAPAPYVKELAARLVPAHEVAVVAYGRLPEKVPAARVVGIDKRQPRPLRLARFAAALWRETRRATGGAAVLYVENGPSAELPAFVVSYLCRARVVLHLGDPRAARGIFTRLLARRATQVVKDSPPERPEMLPFGPKPDLSAWEAAWRAHLAELERIFNGN